MNDNLKTYLIHVKTAVEREKHMEEQMAGKGLDVEYVLEGDLPDLDIPELENYFTGVQLCLTPLTSCGYKHFKVCERMVRDNVTQALVLEDDMFFYSNWSSQLRKVLAEVEKFSLQNYLISLEDSSLKYPKGSERERGRTLYKKKSGRNCGAYIVDIGYAKAVLNYLSEQKCDRPHGLFLNRISWSGAFDIYWCHPPNIVQGTANGTFATTVSKNKTGWRGKVSWFLQRYYKRLLYRLR